MKKTLIFVFILSIFIVSCGEKTVDQVKQTSETQQETPKKAVQPQAVKENKESAAEETETTPDVSETAVKEEDAREYPEEEAEPEERYEPKETPEQIAKKLKKIEDNSHKKAVQGKKITKEQKKAAADAEKAGEQLDRAETVTIKEIEKEAKEETKKESKKPEKEEFKKSKEKAKDAFDDLDKEFE